MPNRLAGEQSPYLLQHADNPVDWYPWGEEAFAARARRGQADLPLDRLLDLPLVPRDGARVVRERTASPTVLNEHFVSIKVDREERPDVDRVYMTFVQATTGSGGWPMSVWLTPELKPFFGGTYFPPTSRWGRPGLRRRAAARSRARGATIARKVVKSAARDRRRGWRGWRRGQDDRRTPGADALDARRCSSSRRPSTAGAAASATRRSFRGRPSCCSCCASTRAPATPARATWWCRRCARWRSAACAITSAAAFTATRSTATGACRTSRRCCTTRRSSCSRTSRRRRPRGDPFFAQVAEDTLQYVERDMTDADGGLLFGRGRRQRPARARRAIRTRTRWKARSTSGGQDEIRAALGDDAWSFEGRFGIQPDGNAPYDPQEEFAGKNLLLHRAVDRRPGARQRQDAGRDCRGAAARAADAVRRARPRGRGRISTTRC